MPRKVLPPAEKPDMTPAEMSDNISFFSVIGSKGKLPSYDVQAIRDRIQWYFDQCQLYSMRPGIEGLALALSTTRQSIWEWSKEQSERGEAIRAAKQTIISLLECWNLTGKLNPASSIFLLKNWAGYQDSISIEATAAPKMEPTHSPEEIARIIETDIPVDDVPTDQG